MQQLIEVTRSFRAMNTGVEAIICAGEERREEAASALKSVQDIFYMVEKQLSRFRQDSELSSLNRTSGRVFDSSPLLFEVLTEAVHSAELTGGAFDPTILPALLAAGYNRSFEKLGKAREARRPPQKMRRHSWREICLDTDHHSVYLPEGCRIDLGGIAKGWTLDRTGMRLAAFPNFAINAGGDIVVRGKQADGSGWSIGIEDPLNKRPNLLVLYLADAAICTSTTTKRRWQINGAWRHHLIDPRTGAPAGSGVISATVIAGSAARAEGLAKAALILGPREGLDLIEKNGQSEGMLIMEDGSCLTSPGFGEYCKP